MVQPLWKAVWRFLKNLRLELPYVIQLFYLCIFIQKHELELIHAALGTLQHYLQ